MLRIIKMNLKIISAFNSLEYVGFAQLISEILGTMSLQSAEKIFTSKWYVWNIMRTKDFYKLMSLYISNKCEDERRVSEESLFLMVMVLTTARGLKTKTTFCNSLSHKNILAYPMYGYMSETRIRNIVSDDYMYLITDDITKIFVNKIRELDAMMDALSTTL